jgi:eukaryotic-like serine/threonine-protein kinase
VRVAQRWVDRIEPSRAGPDREVPDVVGLTRDDALRAVRHPGLEPDVIEGVGGTGRLIVRAQSPAAGVWIRRGARVLLRIEFETPRTIEVAAPRPTVPNVLGRHLANAQSMVRAAFLEPVVVRRVGPTRDTVVLQSPAVGTRVERGSTVTLTIEEAGDAPLPPTPAARIVPNVVGRTSTDAQSAIESLRLRVSWVGDPAGAVVTAQNPAAGTSVPIGTTVRLTVSAPRPPPATTTIVPNVIGMRRNVAASRITALFLTARFVPDLATGVVTGQTPAAGTVVPRGSEVRVTLR